MTSCHGYLKYHIYRHSFKESKIKYKYNDIIELYLYSLPNVEYRTEDVPFYYSGPLKNKNIIAFPVLVKVHNKTKNDIYMFEKFEPTVNLGGNCGINRGRTINDLTIIYLTKIQSNNEIFDTLYFTNCYNYSGDFGVKYNDIILNDKKRIISIKGDSILSNDVIIK